LDEKKKGIFIEESIKTRFDLSWNEKAVLVQIIYMSSGVSMYPINNTTLSKQLGIRERTIKQILTSLFDKKEIMYMRKNQHSPQRFILLYNKATITKYERYGFANNMILEYQK